MGGPRISCCSVFSVLPSNPTLYFSMEKTPCKHLISKYFQLDKGCLISETQKNHYISFFNPKLRIVILHIFKYSKRKISSEVKPPLLLVDLEFHTNNGIVLAFFLEFLE